MATPTFDTIAAQASYGIGLQVGQPLSESGLEGLLPEALVAGIADALEGNQPQVPVEAEMCIRDRLRSDYVGEIHSARHL